MRFIIVALALMAMFSTASACDEPAGGPGSAGALIASVNPQACSLLSANCDAYLSDIPQLAQLPASLKDGLQVKDICPCSCPASANNHSSTSTTAPIVPACNEPYGADGTAGGIIRSVNPNACDQLKVACEMPLSEIQQLDALPADLKAGLKVKDVCPCSCGTWGSTTTTSKPKTTKPVGPTQPTQPTVTAPTGPTQPTVTAPTGPTQPTVTAPTGPTQPTGPTSPVTTRTTTTLAPIVTGTCTKGDDICITSTNCAQPRIGTKESANLDTCTVDDTVGSARIICLEDGKLEHQTYADKSCQILSSYMEFINSDDCITVNGNSYIVTWEGKCGGDDTDDFPSSAAGLATFFVFAFAALFV